MSLGDKLIMYPPSHVFLMIVLAAQTVYSGSMILGSLTLGPIRGLRWNVQATLRRHGKVMQVL
jgi:hypothetical protein